MTPPQNCKCDVIHCVPHSGAGFPELRQVKVGDCCEKESGLEGMDDNVEELKDPCGLIFMGLLLFIALLSITGLHIAAGDELMELTEELTGAIDELSEYDDIEELKE